MMLSNDNEGVSFITSAKRTRCILVLWTHSSVPRHARNDLATLFGTQRAAAMLPCFQLPANDHVLFVGLLFWDEWVKSDPEENHPQLLKGGYVQSQWRFDHEASQVSLNKNRICANRSHHHKLISKNKEMFSFFWMNKLPTFLFEV